MPVSGRTVDRLTSIAIYVGFAILVLWAGIKLISHSLETKFYKDFLLKWELTLHRHNREGGQWPHFSGDNHVQYMDRLTQLMRHNGTSPPLSNTKRAYVYRLNRLGSPEEDLFLLCFPNRIVVYGMSEKTFVKMDKFIDGGADHERGRFAGRPGKDGTTYVGVLQL